MRDRAGLSPLRAPLAARERGVLLPGLRQGPRHQLRLRAGGTPLRRGTERGAPAEHLALRGAAPDRRRTRAGARRAVLGPHAADPRRAPRRRARDRQPVPQGRLLAAAELLLQGPRRVDVDRAPAREGQERDRLRLDRQRRHRRRLAGGQGRRRGLRRVPEPPRGDQGARRDGARREGVPGRGQLRRSQPPQPRGRRSDRHGLREHHAAPVLRRGREDGRLRDRRAARLERARAHPQPGRRRDAVIAHAQGARRAAAARPGGDRRAPRSTSPSRAGATRSRARSSPRRPRSCR